MSIDTKKNKYLSRLEASKAEKTATLSDKERQNKYLSRLEGLPPEPEGIGKSLTRTLAQLPLGYATKYTYPLDLLKMAASGGSEDVLAQLAETEPELRGGVAEEARQKALSYLPTQGMAEELIEQKTGIPLTPQTGLQKNIRLGSSAAGLRPGSIGAKTVAGVAAPTVKAGLEAAGAPEPLAEMGGYVASGITPGPSFKKITKPSGLTTRRFEELKKPVKVSEARHERINEVIESDFRKIADDILSKNETYAELQANPHLKSDVSESFRKVDELAKQIPDVLNTNDIQNAFQKRVNNRPKRGYMESEFEREFNKETAELNNRFIDEDIKMSDVVDQYRKDNEELGELFEPGKSGAANRAKKEALLEHNRAIADVIKEKYPDSEFSKLFENTNKRWSNLMDIDRINEFNNSILSGKINYKQAAKSLEDRRLVESYERLVGKGGYQDIKILTKDLLSTEKGMAQLKIAKNKGFGKLVTYALEYGYAPKLAAGHIISESTKTAFQTLLDKPRLAITWHNAISELSRGNFKSAEKDFAELDKEVKK